MIGNILDHHTFSKNKKACKNSNQNKQNLENNSFEMHEKRMKKKPKLFKNKITPFQ